MEEAINVRFKNSELRIINNRRRREQELRRHICIFVLSIILFFTILILMFSNKSVAAENDNVTLYKYFMTVEIQKGDTLSGLSDEYLSAGYKTASNLMEEIMYINNISEEDKLISGNYIIIPYYDTYRG